MAILVRFLSASLSSSSVSDSRSATLPCSSCLASVRAVPVGGDLVVLDALGGGDQRHVLGHRVAAGGDDLLGLGDQTLHGLAGLDSSVAPAPGTPARAAAHAPGLVQVMAHGQAEVAVGDRVGHLGGAFTSCVSALYRSASWSTNTSFEVVGRPVPPCSWTREISSCPSAVIAKPFAGAGSGAAPGSEAGGVSTSRRSDASVGNRRGLHTKPPHRTSSRVREPRSACLLNTGNKDANMRITIYIADREPLARGIRPPGATLHLPFNELRDLSRCRSPPTTPA